MLSGSPNMGDLVGQVSGKYVHVLCVTATIATSVYIHLYHVHLYIYQFH